MYSSRRDAFNALVPEPFPRRVEERPELRRVEAAVRLEHRDHLGPGRGEHESYCILFAEADSDAAAQRMEAIARTGDGFELAEVDLTLRGEGEILGTRQHGLPRFTVAELPEDAALLAEARREVLAMTRSHGRLDAPELGPLLDAARERFGDERERISA